jgi:hypothetical protein
MIASVKVESKKLDIAKILRSIAYVMEDPRRVISGAAVRDFWEGLGSKLREVFPSSEYT